MRLLYCDETNLEEKSGDFFVYGGVMIDAGTAPDLSREIEKQRTAKGLPPEAQLKFKPNPGALTDEDFIELKDSVIDAAVEHGCKLIICLTLHDLAKDPETARLYGINTVCYHFDCLLNRADSHGLVLIDRFDNKQADRHLREKFSVGLKGLPYTTEKRLDRTLGFHYSAIGQSHFCSLVDILLGSLRFAINSHTRGSTRSLPNAELLLKRISPLFPRSCDGGVPELGIMFSPKGVEVDKYRRKYHGVKDFLSEHGVVVKQEITATPMY